MDKTWMNSNRLSKQYEKGVWEFVEFAVAHSEDPLRMPCPCLGCCYGGKVDGKQLGSHLLRFGIDRSYTCSTMHGEKSNGNAESRCNRKYASNDDCTDTYDCDRVEEIAEALEEDLADCPKMFERLVSDAEKPLYEVEPFVEMHKVVLRDLNPNRNENWIVGEHNRSFIPWFRDHIYSKYRSDPASVTERLRCLAYGPSVIVLSYSAYAINGYTFYTKEQDDKSTMQNSGVTLVAEAMHISSANDLNPKFANLSYFGVIERILVFDYAKFQIPVFGCKWVENNSGVRMD